MGISADLRQAVKTALKYAGAEELISILDHGGVNLMVLKDDPVGATIAWNLPTQGQAVLSLVGNRTMAPANIKNGGIYVLLVNNTGAFNITWPNTFKWPGGLAPPITANGTDLFTFACDGTYMYGTYAQAFA